MEDCPLVQEVVTRYQYLTSQDRPKRGHLAVEYLAKIMDDLLDEKVDYDKFIIAKTYTEPTPPPTAAVVLEMRRNGASVRKGDIIQYMYACPRFKRPGFTERATPKEASFVRNSGGRFIVDVKPYIDLLQRHLLYHVDVATDILWKTRYELDRREAGHQAIADFIEAGALEEKAKTTPYAQIQIGFVANQRCMDENIRILGNRLKWGTPKVDSDEDGDHTYTYKVPIDDVGPQCMKDIIDPVEALYTWSNIAYPGMMGMNISIVCGDGSRIFWTD